jgi:hypothetical protein
MILLLHSQRGRGKEGLGYGYGFRVLWLGCFFTLAEGKRIKGMVIVSG